jgi:hypothetical protein
MFGSMRAFVISREASAAERRYEKEGWKGKLHVWSAVSYKDMFAPPLSFPPPQMR